MPRTYQSVVNNYHRSSFVWSLSNLHLTSTSFELWLSPFAMLSHRSGKREIASKSEKAVLHCSLSLTTRLIVPLVLIACSVLNAVVRQLNFLFFLLKSILSPILFVLVPHLTLVSPIKIYLCSVQYCNKIAWTCVPISLAWGMWRKSCSSHLHYLFSWYRDNSHLKTNEAMRDAFFTRQTWVCSWMWRNHWEKQIGINFLDAVDAIYGSLCAMTCVIAHFSHPKRLRLPHSPCSLTSQITQSVLLKQRTNRTNRCE